MQMKFYSPLTADFFPNEPDYEDEFYDEYEGCPLDGHDLLQYADAVDEAVKKDIADFNGDLMQYYHEDDSVRSKVVSAVPSVEICGNKLCGCLTVELKETLLDDEQTVLCNYISGQYSDGWGEGFEQRDIRVDDGTLAVHFWQEDGFKMTPSFEKIPKPEKNFLRPKMQLIGQDGNIFAIMGRASRLLKSSGQGDKAKEMRDRVMKKYEITDIAHPDNPNLHRIRALTDLTEDVLAGMLGGYVESYDNLDQEGRAWISADAIACDNAVVCGDAVLTDHAVARGNAYVGKNATVMGDASVQDDAIVCGGLLTGQSCVCGYAVIRQDEQTLCAPIIDGSTRIYGEISGNVLCRGDAVVLPGTKLDNRTQDCFVLEDDRVSVQTASRTPPPKEACTHDFER